MISVLSYGLIDMLVSTGNRLTERWLITALFAMEYIPAIALIPRFILALRALHAHRVQGSCGSDIDTAFGLASGPGHDTTMSSIIFAEDGEDRAAEREQGEGDIHPVDGNA